MSDNILRIIPRDPTAVPALNLLEEASRLLAIYLGNKSEDIRVNTNDEVQFIDCGANLAEIRCPSCGRVLDPAWWQQAMEEAYERKFQELGVSTPCCNQRLSLNDLVYDWPAGFAKVSLEVDNPNGDLSPAQQESLETVLGTSTRKIWAHL